MKPIIIKSFRSAVLALGLIGAPFAVASAALIVPGVAQAATAPTIEEMKQTLVNYGEFVPHAKYGDVWKPTVTPRGWRPYPACDWVYTKQYGWYFSDKTHWGAIVHHYGRWIHDEVDGWLWVPGAEFSPGWVVWRTSSEWVGWAPTPPDVDMTPAAMEKFNDDKHWTFMDAKKFGNTCDGGVTVAQYGDVWKNTTYVTDIRFVDGIAVFVLPTWIVGPIVDIDIDVFAPWRVNFIGSWVWNWTNIWNDIDINITLVKNCGPNDPKTPNQNNHKPLLKEIGDDGPPPPPGGSKQPKRDFEPTIKQPKRVQGPGRDLIPNDEIAYEPRIPDRQVGDRHPGKREPGGRPPRGHREVKSFDPLPDAENYPKRGRREVKSFDPLPDAENYPKRGREVGGREPKGRRDVGARGHRETVEREPQSRREPQGRRDAGGQDFDRGFSPRREREAGGGGRRSGGGGDGPTVSRLRDSSGIDRVRGVRPSGEERQGREGRTFNRAVD